MEPKYGFESVCPLGHKIVAAFDRNDVRYSLQNPTKLDLWCGDCQKFYPLSSAQIEQATKDLGVN